MKGKCFSQQSLIKASSFIQLFWGQKAIKEKLALNQQNEQLHFILTPLKKGTAKAKCRIDPLLSLCNQSWWGAQEKKFEIFCIKEVPVTVSDPSNSIRFQKH